MSKSISSRLETAKKWLDRNGQGSATGKTALAALAIAEKSVAELETFKAKLAELAAQKRNAVLALDEALDRAKTEKKLKEKETRLQAKLAALSAAK